MSQATPFFDEAYSMSDTPSRLNIAALAKPANHTLSAIKLGVLAVSVAAAIPTAKNLYFSWQNGVPFNQVEHRLNQAALLEKNFDCKIEYRSLTSAAAARVEVGSCATTGDISIKVSGPGGRVNYEWIAFDQLPKPASQSAGFLDLIVSQALAAETTALPAPAHSTMIRVAEATTEPVCQAKKGDNIIRIVKDGAKCVRETVSIFKGTVEKREEVACDNACPIAN
jgi:hypothetical protein